jgi:hypothetical protein
VTASQEVEQSGSEGLHLISSAFMSVSTIDAQDAIAIFRAKELRMPRDRTSAVLSEQYGITMKAVRDVWNLRTWAWSTMPFWTKRDLHKFLQKHLCDKCRRNGVQSVASACSLCATPRRRGRPSAGAAVATTAVERVLQDSKAAEVAMGAAAFLEKQVPDAPATPIACNPTTPAMRLQTRYAAGYDLEGRDQCKQQQTFTFPFESPQAQMWACEPPSDSRHDHDFGCAKAASNLHSARDSRYSRNKQDCAGMPEACHSSFISSSNASYNVSRAPRNIINTKASMWGLDQGGRGEVSQQGQDEQEEMPRRFESQMPALVCSYAPPSDSRYDNVCYAKAASNVYGARDSRYSRHEQDCVDMPEACHSSYPSWSSSSNASYTVSRASRNISNNTACMWGLDQDRGGVSQQGQDEQELRRFMPRRQLEHETQETCELSTHSWHKKPVFNSSTSSMISNASTAYMPPPGGWEEASRDCITFDEHTAASIDECVRHESSNSMCTAAISMPVQGHPQNPLLLFLCDWLDSFETK